MFTKKRKILFASEASFANTGFAGIYRELISRIHADGRFRVAEFAADCVVNDPRDSIIKWRLYTNAVLDTDPRFEEMSKHRSNKFGRWRFDKVLLDFEPDIVVDLRDPPFFEHEMLSCLQPYFHWCIGPTVDSYPQSAEWIDMFLRADSVAPYTDFGCKVLRDEHKDINVVPNLGPGINIETFKPRETATARQSFGLDKSSKILGFVSRNQGRKLMPRLIRAFAEYLKTTGEKNTFLHLHTAYPDVKPWNITKILLEQEIFNSVLFTYYCDGCKGTFIDKWKDAVTTCKYCGSNQAVHPRTGMGCEVSTMARIFNCYDLYVQYSTCEGLGLGTLEAAASGVPVMTVDYSAMEDLNTNLNGTRIDYELLRDIGTDSERAMPDFNHTVKCLLQVLGKPRELLSIDGMNTRKLCEKHYNWDNIAARWMSHLESIVLTGDQGRWGHGIREDFVQPRHTSKDNTILDQILDGLTKAGRKDLLDSYYSSNLYYLHSLYKARLPHGSLSASEVNSIIENLKSEKDSVMDISLGNVTMESEDFIRYADIKEMANIV